MTCTGNTGKVVTNVKGAFHNNFFKIAYPDSINKDFLVNLLRLEQTQKLTTMMVGIGVLFLVCELPRVIMASVQRNYGTRMANMIACILSGLNHASNYLYLCNIWKEI